MRPTNIIDIVNFIKGKQEPKLVVESADHADIGCILGIGFPTYRGGPLGWADYPRV